MRRILSAILILVGIGVLVYPYGLERYRNYKQEKLLLSWQEAMGALKQSEEASTDKQAEKSSSADGVRRGEDSPAGRADVNGYAKEALEEGKAGGKSKKDKYDAGDVEGIIIIEKINLRLPILSGATKAHLDISVASLEHSGKPGEAGNYCIAGHRSHTYGRIFNRLNELEKDDIIGIQCRNRFYRYVVLEKFLVRPEEDWVLTKTRSKEKEITLITCDPTINPTHRLIVKGKLLEDTVR